MGCSMFPWVLRRLGRWRLPLTTPELGAVGGATVGSTATGVGFVSFGVGKSGVSLATAVGVVSFFGVWAVLGRGVVFLSRVNGTAWPGLDSAVSSALLRLVSAKRPL